MTKKKIRIAIIMACRNRIAVLKLVLKQLACSLRHRNSQVDFFLVDDASKEYNIEKAEWIPELPFSSVTRFRHEQQQGVSRNKVLFACKLLRQQPYDFIVFLDSDIIVHPAWLYSLMGAYKHYTKQGMRVGAVACFTSGTSFKRCLVKRVSSRIVQLNIAPGGHGLLIPRQIFEESGLCQATEQGAFRGGGFDLWLSKKIIRKGYVILTFSPSLTYPLTVKGTNPPSVKLSFHSRLDKNWEALLPKEARRL